MTRQPSRSAEIAGRIRGVVAVVALSVLASHVVAGAASHHDHETEDEACSVCASFASEEVAVQPQQAPPLAGKDIDAAGPVLGTPLPVPALSYSPRGPPKLCR